MHVHIYIYIYIYIHIKFTLNDLNIKDSASTVIDKKKLINYSWNYNILIIGFMSTDFIMYTKILHTYSGITVPLVNLLQKDIKNGEMCL